MNNKKHLFSDLLVNQERMLKRSSSLITAHYSSLVMNSNLATAMQPLRDSIEKLNRVYYSTNQSNLKELTRSLKASMLTDNMTQQLFKLNGSVMESVARNNLLMNALIPKTDMANSMGLLGLDSKFQKHIELFKNFDFSPLINDDSDEFDVHATVDVVLVHMNSNESFHIKIKNILESIKKVNPIVWQLIYFLVISPLQSAYDNEVLDLLRANVTNAQIMESNTSAQKSIIRAEVNNVLNESIKFSDDIQHILMRFRFVNTDELVIRKAKAVNSQSLHILKFGQVIRVLDKHRNWTFIEFIDSNEEVIQGWVFSRYISKFR